jgi:hypothetical protein
MKHRESCFLKIYNFCIATLNKLCSMFQIESVLIKNVRVYPTLVEMTEMSFLRAVVGYRMVDHKRK